MPVPALKNAGSNGRWHAKPSNPTEMNVGFLLAYMAARVFRSCLMALMNFQARPKVFCILTDVMLVELRL
jgi:hypothetical protein